MTGGQDNETQVLLLGSAAVLVAVYGARAADAIIVGPEPVEYARICDAYGSGWFYIPGTETCLRFSGRVRTNYNVTSFDGGRGRYFDATKSYDDTRAHAWQADIELNVQTRNETEYGTLASHMRLNYSGAQGTDDAPGASEGPSAGSPVVERATICLAGLEVGYFDNYWSKAGDYGFFGVRFSGPYNHRSGQYAQYTYAANGMDFTIGLEDGTDSGEARRST